MTDMKRYHVKAEKRVGAREDLPNFVFFLQRAEDYKNAWSEARRACAQGAEVDFLDADASDLGQGNMTPGQYTVRGVYTLDKATAGSTGKGKGEPTLTNLLHRLTHEGVDLDKNPTTKKVRFVINMMLEESNIDTGDQNAKNEVQQRQQAAEAGEADAEADADAGEDEAEAREEQAADAAENAASG